MTDTTTLSATVLTSTDVKALRHADTICFDHLTDGTGRIRAILRAENTNTGFEQTHTILTHSSRVKDYGRDHTYNPDVVYSAYASSLSAKYDGVTRTLARHLKVGCEVGLVWTRDNNSELIRAAGMHFDSLHVHVQPKGAKVADEYLVQASVGYDNSARMIRVVG